MQHARNELLLMKQKDMCIFAYDNNVVLNSEPMVRVRFALCDCKFEQSLESLIVYIERIIYC